jgi:hypothetical protein
MADIKWSAFPNVGSLQSGDELVGLRSGENVQFNAPTIFGAQVITVTGTSEAMATNTIYIANNAAQITFTLPVSASVGDLLCVVGQGAGGWIITQASGQQIIIGSNSSTVTTGSVASTNKSDALFLICITANALWTTFCGPQGNLTIV